MDIVNFIHSNWICHGIRELRSIVTYSMRRFFSTLLLLTVVSHAPLCFPRFIFQGRRHCSSCSRCSPVVLLRRPPGSCCPTCPRGCRRRGAATAAPSPPRRHCRPDAAAVMVGSRRCRCSFRLCMAAPLCCGLGCHSLRSRGSALLPRTPPFFPALVLPEWLITVPRQRPG